MPDLPAIVARLEPLLGPTAGDPSPLDGGITNRNYRVRFGADDYVVRLPGKDTALLGIRRDAERIANEAAAALGIAPEVAAGLPECLVTRYVHCRAVTAEELRAEPVEIAAALRIFHDRGPALPSRFWVPDLLDAYAELAAVPDQVRELARRIETVVPLTDPVPCHNDLLSRNIIRADRLLIVDWEYAGMGHRLFDLGNVAVNNDIDDEPLLSGYLERAPTSGELARLRLMRLMSDAREGAWGVVQSSISSLEFDFDAYADRHFARLHDGAIEIEELLARAATA